MSNIISLKEWKQQKAAESTVVPCGSEKISIDWSPKLSYEETQKLTKAIQGFRDLIKEFNR